MSGIANYKTDPLKAYVLAQYFPTLLDSWDKITDFIKKYSINS